MAFATQYREYIRTARNSREFGFDLKTVARIERFLAFLYEDWWRVDLTGLQHLPKEGPVLIVGNSGGVLPWPAFMLMYALMRDKTKPRRLNILMDMDAIEDERLYTFLTGIGFVPWSADNAKRLFKAGETVAIFPEGITGFVKPFSERYRTRTFNWTKLLPAIEEKVPMVPFATIGSDESFPVMTNLDWLAKFLSMPAFPVTPFFPLLPFPANLYSLPIKWKLRLMKPFDLGSDWSTRDELEEIAKKQALFLEGEVQAELNRLLRQRIKSL